MNNKLIIPGVVAAIALLVIWNAMIAVPSGHVGVVHRLGAVNMQHLEEGLSFKVPFLDAVEEVDVRLRKAENKATAASKDLQVVSTQVAVQYSLDGPTMPKTFQNIGLRHVVESTAIDPGITESVKAITAQYTAEQLVTQRAQVKNKIQEAIEAFVNTTLEQKGVIGAVRLANVAITDFEFSQEFNRAIEEKVRAEQEALKAENEKLRRVTQAEAAYEEQKLGADAESYKLTVESEARAAAIKREAQALKDNPDLIQLRIAEKWDGKLPQIAGGGAIPLLNIDSLRGD